MPLVLTDTLKTALGLALEIRGTLGPIHYRRHGRGRQIVYRERRRTSALTPKQQTHQTKFQRGYEQWRTLTPVQQADWTLVADRFSTRQIGSHLFLREWWHQTTALVDQAARWLNINLVMPGP